MRLMNSNIPEVLKYLRNRIGIIKTELSRRSGVSLTAIIRYENGERIPNLTTLWKMLDVLKADVEITY